METNVIRPRVEYHNLITASLYQQVACLRGHKSVNRSWILYKLTLGRFHHLIVVVLPIWNTYAGVRGL